MSERVSFRKVGVIALLAVMLCIGGVYAYLTATDNVVNKLSIAQALEVEVVEPNWDESKAVDLLPRETVTKDPAVHNLTDTPVWMMADVVVPVREIELSGSDTPVATEVFSYEANSQWVLKDVIEKDDSVVYRYIYPTLVQGGGTTSSIFDEVTACDYKNEQFRAETHNLTIDVIGYGIQADPFDSADAAYRDFFGVPETVVSFNLDGVPIVVKNLEEEIEFTNEYVYNSVALSLPWNSILVDYNVNKLSNTSYQIDLFVLPKIATLTYPPAAEDFTPQYIYSERIINNGSYDFIQLGSFSGVLDIIDVNDLVGVSISNGVISVPSFSLPYPGNYVLVEKGGSILGSQSIGVVEILGDGGIL